VERRKFIRAYWEEIKDVLVVVGFGVGMFIIGLILGLVW